MKSESWESLKKELLKDPEFKREYDKLEVPFQVASGLIALRIKQDLTQAQLAAKIGTKQSAIARLETGYQNVSLELLGKIAAATNTQLKVSFKPLAKTR